MVDRRDTGDAVESLDSPQELSAFERSRRRGCDDVGAESQLRVDTGLLVVGGCEDGEVDAEGEQQAENEEAAIDRAAAAAGARKQEASVRRCAATRIPAGKPRDSAATQTDQHEGGADPEQCGPEE